MKILIVLLFFPGFSLASDLKSELNARYNQREKFERSQIPAIESRKITIYTSKLEAKLGEKVVARECEKESYQLAYQVGIIMAKAPHTCIYKLESGTLCKVSYVADSVDGYPMYATACVLRKGRGPQFFIELNAHDLRKANPLGVRYQG